MSEQHPRDDERRRRIDIVHERPRSEQGTYQYEREDGTTVRGDASGVWTLDENGEVEDTVFFASADWLGDGRRQAAE
jgi:hypothetical protein